MYMFRLDLNSWSRTLKKMSENRSLHSMIVLANYTISQPLLYSPIAEVIEVTLIFLSALTAKTQPLQSTVRPYFLLTSSAEPMNWRIFQTVVDLTNIAEVIEVTFIFPRKLTAKIQSLQSTRYDNIFSNLTTFQLRSPWIGGRLSKYRNVNFPKCTGCKNSAHAKQLSPWQGKCCFGAEH